MILRYEIKIAADGRIHRLEDWRDFMGDTNVVQSELTFLVVFVSEVITPAA